MIRSLALISAVAAALAALAAAGYGPSAGYGVLAILLPLGVATTLGAHAIAARRSQIGGLRRQLALVAALAAAQLAIAVVLFVELMFVSAHDAYFTALLAAFTGTVGLWAGRLVAGRALADLESVRGALRAVADGRRDVHAGLAGRDELARLGADVDAMIDRLALEERARSTLIAGVSHDLRTPITSLQLLAEAIDDEVVSDPATRREYVLRMATHVRSLGTLIDDLFELTRLESRDIRWGLEHVRLDDLVREALAAMRPHADARSVSIRAEIDPQLAPARANPEQIQRVLFNLIQNAIRHTPADGSVVVRAEPAAAGAIEVEVVDSGEGIAAGDRGHVFQAFFRGGDSAARTDGGAGLGLAIARAIVEAHGGTIWLEDAARGTSVRFRLPAATA